MKKIIVIILAFNAILLLLVGVLFYLSETYPAKPGDQLFEVQSLAENLRVQLTGDPARRAEMSFSLVERRLANLMVADESNLDAAIIAFDKNLTTAIQSLEAVPQDQGETVLSQVQSLLARVDVVMNSISDKLSSTVVQELSSKIRALQAATYPADITQLGSENSRIPAIIKSKTVSFLGKEVNHGEFPLFGGHDGVECETCHADGEYEDTPANCDYCHKTGTRLGINRPLFPQVTAATHIDRGTRDCSECHSVWNWTELEFAHEDITTCTTCHKNDVPNQASAIQKLIANIDWSEVRQVTLKTGHYPGECAECHQDTDDWRISIFNHKQDTCQDCHGSDGILSANRPINEGCSRIRSCTACHSAEVPTHEEVYPGACTNCHNDVENWLNIGVDHSNYSNCATCHTDDRPVKHYRSTCSNCHGVETWTNSTFDHKITSNCAGCHEEPNPHYPGQCSVCHTLTGWRETEVMHTITTCETCHTKSNSHMLTSLTCNSCHVTTGWTQSIHNGAVACTICHTAPSKHYVGQCQECHTTTGWRESTVFHRLSTCSTCHPTPYKHYTIECGTCHTVSSWYTIQVNHTQLLNCITCHTTPVGHYTLNCSTCHSTTAWLPASYPHSITDDCLSCHRQPTGHWPGQCSLCHNTSNWSEVTFNHTGYTDCKACHSAPSGHDRGQCSKCHTTVNWIPIPTPTPLATVVPTATSTPVPPTSTPTPLPTVGLPTETPVPLPTNTPEPLPTDTLEPTATYTPEPSS